MSKTIEATILLAIASLSLSALATATITQKGNLRVGGAGQALPEETAAKGRRPDRGLGPSPEGWS